MYAKTFLGTLAVTIGEYENKPRLLVVANSEKQALQVLEEAAASFYGEGDEPCEDGGYYANGGEVHTKAHGLAEIGRATFDELSKLLSVCTAPNVRLLDVPELEPELKGAAAALTASLAKRNVVATSTQVLDAMASALGAKSWQVLKAKVAKLG